MSFRKINNWLHLWLGLISGIIVFVVCVTGCIWVFNEEITAYFIEPETRIEIQNKPVISPSEIQKIAGKEFPGMKISYANYQSGRTVNVGLGERRKGGAILKLNPYTGEIISKSIRKEGEADFFRFILNGHRFLWLPYEIGRPIVNYATLIFVVLLITGLIWWYPKKWNKSTREKSFKIKWGASFKRVNLDLHNVLGFYSFLFLLAIALTGMVWGIKWYSQGLYWVTSGGETLKETKRNSLESDSLQAGKFYTPRQAIDLAFTKAIQQNPKAEGFYYNFPDTSKSKSIISIYIYPTSGQFYNNKQYKFDQHTLKELKGDHPVYDKSFEEAGFGGKLRKMNYDIHVGSILGFPGKVLAFLVTLIGASLPITGFLIWWGRKFGKNKKGKNHKNGNGNNQTPQIRENFIPQTLKKNEPIAESVPVLQIVQTKNLNNTKHN